MPRLDNITQCIKTLEKLRVRLGEVKETGAQEHTQALISVIRTLEKYRDCQGQFVPEPFPLKHLEKLRVKLGEIKELSAQEHTQALTSVIKTLEKHEE